ncbi:hypothetical protein [Treponema sp.]|uniref:hypothetical protein n=1 Tax=Treponema sp. TaxID=166 RepID=UPI00298E4140|nr:hypothetical protein [Treponema sp.]MCR5613264.1 hypothetical protein [Treponema sp.]
MKKTILILLLTFGIFANAFSGESFGFFGVTLDAEVIQSEKLANLNSDKYGTYFLPGIQFGVDFFQTKWPLGFHIDGSFLVHLPTKDQTSIFSAETITFCAKTLAGPVLRAGNVLFLTVGGSAGLNYCDSWTTKTRIGSYEYKETHSLFQAYLGVGAELKLWIAQTICFGANFNYYPLCSSTLYSKSTKNKIDFQERTTMFRGGIFIAIMFPM